MWDYSDKVRDHFLNPRNVGEIENPDGVAEVGSIACGDMLKIAFKLDENKRIRDAKFKTFGCASAIASASALTEMLKGLTVEEAEKITNQDIAEYLGGLPDAKMHCSVLGREALEKAVANYRGLSPVMLEGTLICECFGVTDKEIERAVRENDLSTVDDVTHYTKAGGGCGKCHTAIQEIIDRVRIQPMKKKQAMTNLQKIKLIEETLDREIRPLLKHDGGDIELVDIIDNRVLVAKRGTCAACQAFPQTLKEVVEKKLHEMVSPDLVVEEVVQ
ncbi:MAG: Fe-S cluster assembly protein NifU [Deltaproteobacteria bacterium]|nr:Fe-S cluster assembly protein NifU [Deltaproteobacteria bacterium]